MNAETFLKSTFKKSADAAGYIGSYMARIGQMVNAVDAAALSAVVEKLETAIEQDKSIFLLGNGGSSAAASHMVNDLGANSLTEGAPGVRIFNLTDNIASVTAAANDAGYEDIFLLQLKSYLRSGDLVIGFSVSGNSPNIIRALTYAREMGCATIGFTGFDGGQLRIISDVHVNFPSTKDEYGPVEDMFSIVGHAVSGFISMKRGRWLHH
jgi:D-sedoheptulose 7-phosphate isomerase